MDGKRARRRASVARRNVGVGFEDADADASADGTMEMTVDRRTKKKC